MLYELENLTFSGYRPWWPWSSNRYQIYTPSGICCTSWTILLTLVTVLRGFDLPTGTGYTLRQGYVVRVEQSYLLCLPLRYRIYAPSGMCCTSWTILLTLVTVLKGLDLSTGIGYTLHHGYVVWAEQSYLLWLPSFVALIFPQVPDILSVRDMLYELNSHTYSGYRP